MSDGEPRILAILLGLIGDTMMRLPVLRALREARPEAVIEAVCDPVTAPVLQVNPLFDAVHVFDRRGLGVLDQLRFYARLRRRRYDVTLDFYYGARTPLLAWCTGASRRIGPARGRLGRLLLTDPLPLPDSAAHMVDRHLPIAAPLGATSCRRRWEFPVPASAVGGLERKLAAAGVGLAEVAEDLVVCIGAGDVSKRWDDDFQTDLLRRVAGGELGDRRVLLVADRREPALAATWAALPGVTPLPPLELPELGALFAAAALVLVPDTGPMHVGLATARRLLTFFQSTDPDLHRADRPAYRALYEEVCPHQPCDTRLKHLCALECRRSITVDAMLAAMQELLTDPAPAAAVDAAPPRA